MNKTTLVVAFFLAAVLAGLFLHFNMRLPPMPTTKETFMQQEVGMPVNGGGMGPYDQVSLAGGVSGWSHTEDSAPIGASTLPSQADSTNEIMFLVDNKVDSECCPSAFTTDTGCVCLTEENRQLMASRGGNRA
jgi:hypothetical protein